MFSTFTIAIGALALIALVIVAIVLSLRRVVSTNETHIIQTRKKTVSYGKGEAAGNVYYKWPAWLPILGMTSVVLPVSVFAIDLPNYDAYDNKRVPFLVHVIAFFRINDSTTAAQRVSSAIELKAQLTAMMQGAVRTVLAGHDIDQIMIERSKFGQAFTEELKDQLGNWGVETVKNIELMDIRDAKDSNVIQNIMSKRTSEIDKESRVVVAENGRAAKEAEIAAQQAVEVRRQEAEELVGRRTAEKNLKVGVANQQTAQEVAVQQRETAIRDQAVAQVNQVRSAEIAKDVSIVQAEQLKQTSVIAAEGVKQQSIIKAEGIKQTSIIQAEGTKTQTVLTAEGALEAKRKESEGITLEGAARASAEAALLLAPVTAQIELAKEIGSNDGYQKYLLGKEQISANKEVGIAQAGALEAADIKILTNAGTPVAGVQSVMDLFSSQGGQGVVGLLESLGQSDTGRALIDKVIGKPSEAA